jgi:hypothetical protein
MSPVITCLSLIDITATGILRGTGETRDQQRNWESVLQVLGLKTQPLIIREPVCFQNEDLDFFEFGEFYEGKHSVWAFQFRGERDDFYLLEQLEEDFDQVPVTLGLEETARFMLPIFHTHGTLKNIYFIQKESLNII